MSDPIPIMDVSDNPQPLPCPFCGMSPVREDGSLSHTSDDREKWGAIQCWNCGAIGPDVRASWRPFDQWQNDAISAWNERTPAFAAALGEAAARGRGK